MVEEMRVRIPRGRPCPTVHVNSPQTTIGRNTAVSKVPTPCSVGVESTLVCKARGVGAIPARVLALETELARCLTSNQDFAGSSPV